MSQKQPDNLLTTVKYPSQMCKYLVHGFEVEVENEILVEALSTLPDQAREIVLLSYCLGMNDVEISTLLKVIRCTVRYQRTSSLRKIKRYMEGFDDAAE